MPMVKKDNKYKKIYTDNQMEDAIKAVKNGMSQCRASKKYGIPKSTIQFRLSSAFIKATPGPSPVLGCNGEEDLVRWIIDCQRRGFPRKKINIQASVKELLDQSKIKNPFRNNVPGNGWYKAFFKRHPILTERFPEVATKASSCESESDIKKWFSEIYNFLSENKYLDILRDPTRIFNGDETYFIVCPIMKNIIAPLEAQKIYEIDHGNSKLNLTMLFTFSATGLTTPPTLVFPYKKLPSAIRKSVPNDWGIGVTPNGWMNAELFCVYLKNIFHPYLIKEKITLPVILFVDGHSSHVTLDVSNLCRELKIILICLHPNSTILQPADVSAFKPMKSMLEKSVLEWRQQNPTQLLKLDEMVPLLKNALDEFSLNGDAVKHSFKSCGLYPWDPNDYSNCLGAKTIKSEENPIHRNPIHQNPIHRPSATATVSFETFTKIVGEDLLKEIELFSSDLVNSGNKSKEFVILQQLLKEYEKNCDPIDNNNYMDEANIKTEESDVTNNCSAFISNDDMDDDIIDESSFINMLRNIKSENGISDDQENIYY